MILRFVSLSEYQVPSASSRRSQAIDLAPSLRALLFRQVQDRLGRSVVLGCPHPLLGGAAALGVKDPASGEVGRRVKDRIVGPGVPEHAEVVAPLYRVRRKGCERARNEREREKELTVKPEGLFELTGLSAMA
jgi:hypothetical protein